MGHVEDGEALAKVFDRLAALRDVVLVNRSELARGAGEVLDAVGIEPHEPRGGGIDGGRVSPDDEASEFLWRSHDWSIAFHPDDPIRDRKRWSDRGVDVEDGFGDAVIVQHVLRPAVDDTRHDTEEVFHAAGNAGPVVRLELGHRDNEVRFEQRLGKI